MKILVVGAGMQAHAVCYDLVRQQDVDEVRVADVDAAHLAELKRAVGSPKLRTFRADASDEKRMAELMKPCAVAVSCVPYFFNLGLTRAAIATKTHFCDLGGSNTVVDEQMLLGAAAQRAGVSVVPDCGLAPGMVSILAADGFVRLDKTEAIHLRVGGLPRHPKPPLNYGLVFSPNGLINEYVEPCLVIRNRKMTLAEPLADLEEMGFAEKSHGSTTRTKAESGTGRKKWLFGNLEAFNTSGGTSRLPLTFAGCVKTLDYKTIRYPGHCALVRLLYELGLTSMKPVNVDGQQVVPRRLLIQRLEAVLPAERDDVVLLRVLVKGVRKGRPKTICYELVDYADRRTGLTAMMRTTGFSAAVVALLLARGQVPVQGVFTGENGVPPDKFIAEFLKRGMALRTTGRRRKSPSPLTLRRSSL